MKRASIGSSLVRYLRRAATSAWGKISRAPAAESPQPIAYFMGADGNMYANHGDRIEQLTHNADAVKAALRISDPGSVTAPSQSDGPIELHFTGDPDPFAGEPHAEGPPPRELDWPTWVSMVREFERPGWTFCRFGVRSDDNGVAQMFGFVRDGFGMFNGSFWCCGPAGNSTCALWTLIHLRTGACAGLFFNAMSCAMGGEIAARMLEPSADHIEPDEWRRLHSAWRAAAIAQTDDVHAHQMVGEEIGSGTLHIWSVGNVLEGRPERLS